MSSRIDKYLLEKSEELVFITIEEDGDINLDGYDIPIEGLKAPLKSEVLVKGIKDNSAQESINMMSIVDAMIYMQGIDTSFIYNTEYDRFIEAFQRKADFDRLGYAGYMSSQSYEKGELKDALVYIRSFLRTSPDDVMGLYQYAIICQEMSIRYGKDENIEGLNDFLLEALNSLEKIIDIDEDFALSYYQLGFHYANQMQYVKANRVWNKALELGLEENLVMEVREKISSISDEVVYEEGYNLAFQGRADEGLEKLLPLEEKYPDWWNLLFVISVGYKSKGDIGEAKKYLEKILVTKPTQVDTLVELALCNAEEGNLAQCIDLLTRASKLRKEDPEILCNLGMAFLYNNEIDEARYYIERAYEINPLDEVTIACMKELEKYGV